MLMTFGFSQAFSPFSALPRKRLASAGKCDRAVLPCLLVAVSVAQSFCVS